MNQTLLHSTKNFTSLLILLSEELLIISPMELEVNHGVIWILILSMLSMLLKTSGIPLGKVKMLPYKSILSKYGLLMQQPLQFKLNEIFY